MPHAASHDFPKELGALLKGEILSYCASKDYQSTEIPGALLGNVSTRTACWVRPFPNTDRRRAEGRDISTLGSGFDCDMNRFQLHLDSKESIGTVETRCEVCLWWETMRDMSESCS